MRALLSISLTCLVACGAAPAAPSDAGGDGAGAGRDAGALVDAPISRPPDPCIAAGNCQPGTWVNVTPPEIDLGANLPCGNYGTLSVQVDPAHAASALAHFDCRGVWRSEDYGLTWTGPVNTGQNGDSVADCAGGITLVNGTSTILESYIRGAGVGFWRSENAGVDWTRYSVAPGADRQDFYPPSVNPYDPDHLLMCGHEMNVYAQSSDGGRTWTAIQVRPEMNQMGGTAALLFVDTGSAATTRDTWLYLAQASGGTIGTWRTEDGGTSWTLVDQNEKAHSYSQLYQPDTRGTLYMAGVYSALGWGVLRSDDYGVHWAHVGVNGNLNIVFGTSRHIYALDAYNTTFEIADPDGTNWTMADGPPAQMVSMGQGSGTVTAAVTSDGTYNILLAADWNAGLWRYVEPN